MDESFIEILFIINQFIKYESNHLENTNDLISTNISSKYRQMYFKCLECFDCPRIIFIKKDEKIYIKAYCYCHNDGNVYTLKQFIHKFGVTKDKEIINEEYLFNISQSKNDSYESENNEIIQDNILPIDNNSRYYRYEIRYKAKNCEKHNKLYTKYNEIKDSFLCDDCYTKDLNIQKNDRIENISDLISKINIKIINYIEKRLKDLKAHIKKLKNLKDKFINFIL